MDVTLSLVDPVSTSKITCAQTLTLVLSLPSHGLFLVIEMRL